MQFIIIIILIWLICFAVASFAGRFRKLRLWVNAYRSLGFFDHQYIESKAFFTYQFRKVPTVVYIDEVDVAKAFEYINSELKSLQVNIYQSCDYSHERNRQEFTRTIFVLNNNVIIELGTDYAEVLHLPNDLVFSAALVNKLAAFKMPEKKKAFEINIITHTAAGLDLKQLDIEPTHLDIDLYYNDDFKEIDGIIRKRLEQKSDKGIILLHGLPGTGKTTYLRHLIGSINKRVLFLSPAVAGNLMNPEFMDLLIDNPNAVLVIEDAENIIMDRRFSGNSSVSNLLNISDGLLSDCLNVQIICTFNSALNTVDSALLRKGRLIAKYEFDKLSVSKSQRLSDELGFNITIEKPMTLAEIANPDEMDFAQPAIQVMGFRREALMN
ncbi:MAG: family ATPase [Ferruginibacter sp.]|uniref:AAA family ATPase n=1 Tax=Ferruginibacter sp. TaxID=1940288 RepID=UPI002658904C|nr:AAA family ATPase [Ferruginibacter sp.]MDB5280486.1 family ATPase [Ferruginibacter sp.]